MKECITSPELMPAIGPYAHAVRAGDFLYTSGQVPMTKDGKLAGAGIEEQAEQVLKNLEFALKAGGARLDQVVKTLVFVSDMNNFDIVNKIYGRYFKENPPSRSCVETARLPKDFLIEIEAVAYLK